MSSLIAGDLDGLLSGFLRRAHQRAVSSYLREARKVLDMGCGVFRPHFSRHFAPNRTSYLALARCGSSSCVTAFPKTPS